MNLDGTRASSGRACLGYPHRVAIGFVAGTLNCSAAFSIAVDSVGRFDLAYPDGFVSRAVDAPRWQWRWLWLMGRNFASQWRQYWPQGKYLQSAEVPFGSLRMRDRD
jgi:hypothetical protein